MPVSDSLTQPQRNTLALLVDLADRAPQHGERPVTPKQLAQALWPNSEAWSKRTRGRRTGTVNGAMGGTMPMKAATLLWRLHERGLAEQPDRDSNDWLPTALGRRVAAGTDVPRPKPGKAPEPKVERALKPAHLRPGARRSH